MKSPSNKPYLVPFVYVVVKVCRVCSGGQEHNNKSAPPPACRMQYLVRRFFNPLCNVASIRRIAVHRFAVPTLRKPVDFLCKKPGAFCILRRCTNVKGKMKFCVELCEKGLWGCPFCGLACKHSLVYHLPELPPLPLPFGLPLPPGLLFGFVNFRLGFIRCA